MRERGGKKWIKIEGQLKLGQQKNTLAVAQMKKNGARRMNKEVEERVEEEEEKRSLKKQGVRNTSNK